MDENGGYYAKWNNSEQDKQYIISIIWNLKKKKNRTQKQSRKVIAKAWRMGEIGRGLLKVTHFHIQN